MKAQNLEDVTPDQRHALLAITARQIRTDDPDHGGISTITITVLHRRGWIAHGHDKLRRSVWKITDVAWAIVTAETPRLLTPAARPSRRHDQGSDAGYRIPGRQRLEALELAELGYTTIPSRAMPGEPEAVDEATQRRITERAGMTKDQRQAVEQDRNAYRLLAEAKQKDVNTERELRRLRALEAEIVRKLSRDAAA